MNDPCLLVHADPGARSGFLAAWLTDNLKFSGFDVGATTNLNFCKIHVLDDSDKIINFPGIKIRIKPSLDKLNLHLLLFLKKNILTCPTNFIRDEFSLETFSEVYIHAKECFKDDASLNYSYYDHVIDFCDTFDLDKLADLYFKFNNRHPSLEHVNYALNNNLLNEILIEKNHACNIAAMLLATETRMNLKEENRMWSLPEIYNTNDKNELYTIIESKIKAENYQSV
jgi:hypothetical protein